MTSSIAVETLGTIPLTSLVPGDVAASDQGVMTSVDPWTQTSVAEAQIADRATIDRSIDAAISAERRYGAASWSERGQLLAQTAMLVRERTDELAALAVREVGKPISEAIVEAHRVAGIIDFYAAEALRSKGELFPSGEAGVTLLTRRRPIGTTLVVTPWNFPLAIPAWKIAPALLCGNPVIWKPATAAIGCANALARCFLDAGFPEDVLMLLMCPGSSITPVLDAPIAAVSFTGSTAVGHQIRERASSRGVRVQLELGGKNVAIVLDDADLSCAEMIARAAYGFTGQKCTATSVVLATAAVRDELVERLATITRTAPWGDPRDKAVWGGPLIDVAKREELDDMIAAARAGGAELIARGPDFDQPAAFAPAVLHTRDRTVAIARDELFGPVLTVLDAQNPDALVDVANDSEYGLVASIFGQDSDTIRQLANQLDVGLIAINRLSTGLEVQAPAGGWKASGDGEPEQGQEAIRFFTKNQTVYWKSRLPGAMFP